MATGSAEQPVRLRADPVTLGAALLFLVGFPTMRMIRVTDPLDDPDVLWHILLGRHLLSTWDFGPADPFGTPTTQPWVYNQWLPEVLFAVADRLGGLPAVAWLAEAGRVLLFAALWWLCRRWAGPLPAVFAAIVAHVGISGSLGPRPQLFGLILLVVMVGAWLRTAADGRPRWWLIPLTWLFACTHGMWTIGVGIGFLMSVGQVLDRRRDPWRAHLPRFLVPVGGVLVAAFTPVGLPLLTAPFQVSRINDLVSEWQAPSLTGSTLSVVIVAAGIVVLAWVRDRAYRPDWTRLLILAAGVAFALLYVRTIAVGAVLVAGLLAETLERVVGRPRLAVTAAERVGVVAGLAVCLAAAALLLPTTAREPSGVPRALEPALADLPAQTIYNHLGLGGWILYTQPQLTPVFDTRWEAYGREYAEAWIATTSAQRGWQQWFDETGAKVALLPDRSPLVSALLAERGWIEVGTDAGYVLVRAPG